MNEPAAPANLSEALAEVDQTLDQIETAEPASPQWEHLGLELLDEIDQAGPANMTMSIIDRLAKMVLKNDATIRVIAARALGEIGPPAARALPSLEKAVHADEEILNQNFGLAVGPEGPYETALQAIRRIKGNPEPGP